MDRKPTGRMACAQGWAVSSLEERRSVPAATPDRTRLTERVEWRFTAFSPNRSPNRRVPSSSSRVSQSGSVEALENVSLTVLEGEFVCLLGPSGCGKSTLLDIMAGLTKPDRGQVLSDGHLVTGPNQQRLVMFQEAAPFPCERPSPHNAPRWPRH